MKKVKIILLPLILLIASPPQLVYAELAHPFLRGDANGDQAVNLTDAIYILEWIFKGGPAPACMDAADVNDDGDIDISDAVFLLFNLFLKEAALPQPFLIANIDPTTDNLTCLGSPFPLDKVVLSNNKLYVQNTAGIHQPFEVKGVTYTGLPTGAFLGQNGQACYYNFLNNQSECSEKYLLDFIANYAFDRDFPAIASLGANTIRTYNRVTPEFLKKANQYGLMAVVGFWINYDKDFTDQAQRQEIINGFVEIVSTLRNDPNYGNVLAIAFGNENDVFFCDNGQGGKRTECDVQAQSRAFYALANEAFLAAKTGPTSSRPMIIVSADKLTFGNPLYGKTDDNLPYLDAWGIDLFTGPAFDDYITPQFIDNEFFIRIAQGTKKPLIVTEFGTDSFCNKSDPNFPCDAGEDETKQAEWITSQWNIIHRDYSNNGSLIAGGIITTWVDQWSWFTQWTKTVWEHNPGGFGPAGCVGLTCDFEYFGINKAVPGYTPDNLPPPGSGITMEQIFSLEKQELKKAGVAIRSLWTQP